MTQMRGSTGSAEFREVNRRSAWKALIEGSFAGPGYHGSAPLHRDVCFTAHGKVTLSLSGASGPFARIVHFPVNQPNPGRLRY
jgi:hypothetical protein